jgi:hypothetical protein
MGTAVRNHLAGSEYVGSSSVTGLLRPAPGRNPIRHGPLTIPDVDLDGYVIRANDVLSLEVQGVDFKLICFCPQ